MPPWSVHRGRTGIWQVKGLRADQEHNRPVKVVDVYGTDEDSRQKNAEIIAAVPDLIAELKRCYEQLDEANKEGEALWNVLDNWDICMDDYSMHDLYNNLDEKYDRNDEGRIILKELYSYTEEDGWQQKEPASE